MMTDAERRALAVAHRLMGGRCEDCEEFEVFPFPGDAHAGFCKKIIVKEEGKLCCSQFVRRKDPE